MNSRFGTTLDEASELIGVATKLGLNVNGIHFHVGSQASKPENWRAGIHIAAKLFETYPSLKVLNLGGGLPGAYQPADDAIPTILAAIKDELQLTFQKQPDLYIELGRSLVANAALTCASVIQIEEQLPVSTATLDISIFAGMIEIFESNYAIQYPIWTTGNGPLVEYQFFVG